MLVTVTCNNVSSGPGSVGRGTLSTRMSRGPYSLAESISSGILIFSSPLRSRWHARYHTRNTYRMRDSDCHMSGFAPNFAFTQFVASASCSRISAGR